MPKHILKSQMQSAPFPVQLCLCTVTGTVNWHRYKQERPGHRSGAPSPATEDGHKEH